LTKWTEIGWKLLSLVGSPLAACRKAGAFQHRQKRLARLLITMLPFRASSAKGAGTSFPIGASTEDQVMMNADMERHIGETMAVVLRERLMELETLEATGKATEDTVSRLAFVRKLLVQFDAKNGHAASVSRPANTNRKPTARDPASARTG
jgi:hypothetical protein